MALSAGRGVNRDNEYDDMSVNGAIDAPDDDEENAGFDSFDGDNYPLEHEESPSSAP